MAASGSNQPPAPARPSTSPSRIEGQDPKHPAILIIEDSQADLFLIREALSAAEIDADLHIIHDGEQATIFIDRVNAGTGPPCPTLVILDLNIPRVTGIEVLSHLRATGACKNARVLVLTSSNSARDKDAVMALGIDCYFRKPSSFDDFLKLGPVIKQLLTT